ncbi:MAG: 1-acyl-sn-glycerol-3-phosphate acyltransferase [Acidimicrobiales bacterium]
MLIATGVGLAFAPVALPMLAVVDLIRADRHFHSPRAYLFALQYMINDSVEILAAPALWAIAGFGRSLDSPASQRRHERLQNWSIRLLAKRAGQLLRVGVVVASGAETFDHPGPTIVLTRHCSIFDTSLPALLYQERGFRVRGVIMAELLADPGFDLIFGRLGSVFVPRTDGDTAKSMIAHLASDLDTSTVAAIFPEGRLFTPDRLTAAMERLRNADPDRAERLATLTNVLPPKAGGVAALLAGAPNADVVVIGHTGLESFRPFSLRRPQGAPVTVRVHPIRYPRSTIPVGDQAIQRWLDDRWIELDLWIADQARPDPRHLH